MAGSSAARTHTKVTPTMSTAIVGNDSYVSTPLYHTYKPTQPNLAHPVPSSKAATPQSSNVPLTSHHAQAGLAPPPTSADISVIPSVDELSSQIQNYILDPPSPLLPPLVLRGVSPTLFFRLMETPMYRQLEDSDSHVRFDYNSVTRSLAIQCGSNAVHDTANAFMNRNLWENPDIVPALRNKITPITGDSLFMSFAKPYEESRKQPDFALRVGTSIWPTVVVEVGWSESYEDLVEDGKLWLIGGRIPFEATASQPEQHCVNAIILIHFDHRDFSKDNSQPFNGVIELWHRDSTSAVDVPEIERCSSIKFYPSLPADAPPFEITFVELFGAQNLPPNVPGDTCVRFDLQYLITAVNNNTPHLLQMMKDSKQQRIAKQQQKDDEKRKSEMKKRARTKEDIEDRDLRAVKRANLGDP